MPHKGHVSLTRYNWYFKWTPNIKSYEVSVPRYCFLNLFPSIENQRGTQGIQDILNTCAIKNTSTDCLIEGIKLCLYNNNSMFANENLLKANGTAIGVPSSCSYPDIVAASLDHTIMEH